MAFTLEKITDEVLERLELPPAAQARIRARKKQQLLCDLDKKAVIVCDPLHYSEYPDWSFTLFIGGKTINANCKYVRSETAHDSDWKMKYVLLHHRNDPAGIGDEQLKSVVHDFFRFRDPTDKTQIEVHFSPSREPLKIRSPTSLLKQFDDMATLATLHNFAIKGARVGLNR